MSAIVVKNLCKTYKNGLQAVNGINLTIDEGDFYALLGPNGAGKTTIIGIITSLITKTAGEVCIGGFDLDSTWQKARALLGVVPQEINLNTFETCWDVVIQQAAYYGVPSRHAKQKAKQLFQQLDLWHKRDKTTNTLSGGMKRRLMIIRALVHDPKILILDEPTAGVDVEIRQSMWSFLSQYQRQGLTVLLTTHYLEEAENLCHHIAILDRGEVVKVCPTRELLRQLEQETLVFNLEKSYDVAPKLTGFATTLTAPDTLEVEIQRGQNLNAVFEQFNQHDIAVMSMRNKASRLEQLYMRLIDQKNRAGADIAEGKR